MSKILLLVLALLLGSGALLLASCSMNNNDQAQAAQKIYRECVGTVSFSVTTGSEHYTTITCTETPAERNKKDEANLGAKSVDGKQAP
jgi:hypothetical protein